MTTMDASREHRDAAGFLAAFQTSIKSLPEISLEYLRIRHRANIEHPAILYFIFTDLSRITN